MIGKPAWDGIAKEHKESFRAAFAMVVRDKTAVIWDGRDLHGTRWRNWMFPMVRRRCVAAIVRKWPQPLLRLTSRDRRICAGIAGGRLAKEIATRLKVSISTVNNRRSQIAAKLGIHPSALPGWCGLHEEWLS